MASTHPIPKDSSIQRRTQSSNHPTIPALRHQTYDITPPTPRSRTDLFTTRSKSSRAWDRGD
ncbi:hypothetical protein TRIP_B310006 [uncultured Desulfatiglans sp.]|nr:hypothetical protein TRIP_B310006 [uncultured Desulfatiglans sp.]